MTENKFVELKKLNVNEHTEKKGNLTYLSWAWAWGIFQEHYPDADYEVREYDNKLYFKDESGCHVYTYITAGGKKKPMWLPIMDFKNQPVKNPTSTDVNKAVMRCLTKNMAMFGLGLYIYAGEDLPEGEDHPKPNTEGHDLSTATLDNKDFPVSRRMMDDPAVKEEFTSRGVDFDKQADDMIEIINNQENESECKAWREANRTIVNKLPTKQKKRVMVAYDVRLGEVLSKQQGVQ
jgi:hypothetical protein